MPKPGTNGAAAPLVYRDRIYMTNAAMRRAARATATEGKARKFRDLSATEFRFIKAHAHYLLGKRHTAPVIPNDSYPDVTKESAQELRTWAEEIVR
jgi:type II secretory pathway component HofQ